MPRRTSAVLGCRVLQVSVHHMTMKVFINLSLPLTKPMLMEGLSLPPSVS